MVQPIETADRLLREIVTGQQEVDELEYKLDFGRQGVRSMEDIQSELNTFQNTKYETHFLSLLLSIVDNIFYLLEILSMPTKQMCFWNKFACCFDSSFTL